MTEPKIENPKQTEGGEKPKESPETKTIQEVVEGKIAELEEKKLKSSDKKEISIFEAQIKELKDSLETYKEECSQIELDTQKEEQCLYDQLEGAFSENPDQIKNIIDDAIRREQAEDKIKTLENIDTVGDLRELPVAKLLELEKKHEGILLFAFTDFVDDKEKIDLEHFESFYKEPKEGVTLTISFRGNESAEMEIGAVDIFPPSVRKITVLEQGDKNRARTSEKRIGLKNGGFYDNIGYIPIFSGDAVIIGGTDIDFEKKYRTENGALDFDKYEKENSEEENDFLDKLGPTAQRNKIMTEEEIKNYMAKIKEEEEITGESASGRVLDSIEQNIKTFEGKHCWDWVNQIYTAAGVKSLTIRPLRKYPGKDCGDNNYNDLFDILEPGDWLYINNKNQFDQYGNHSVIFMGWDDKENKIARTASCSRAGQKGRVGERRDFSKTPVTYIAKPRITA